ncbi:MAG: 4Fe-4S dicluster domain-containing protein [Candidatus Aenigmatarchaeota archaeon]
MKQIWIARDYSKCSGCRRCEIACSLKHEGEIWPEASRIRIFMLIPGIEVPHLCVQCPDYPCVEACPTNALSINKETSAVEVDKEKCIACGKCIDACPGKIPHMHPTKKHIIICNLCNGDPECVKVCQEGRWNALWAAPRPDSPVSNPLSIKLYARTPQEITKDLARNIYGEEFEKEVK